MLFLLISTTFAAPLNPWGSATATGTALVNPYIYFYPEASNPIIYGATGLSDRVDVFLGVGSLLSKDASTIGSLEFFPRFFVNPSLAFAAHLYWSPAVDGVILAPEVHANHSWDHMALTANIGWRPVLSSQGFSAGSIPLVVAPELRLGQRFSFYTEVDPTFSLSGDPLSMLVVPGFGATLDAEGHHSLSVGIQIPVLPSVDAASLGAWYCFTFPTRQE